MIYLIWFSSSKSPPYRGRGLGKYRWVVERTNSWLHQYRRQRVRYERRGDIHEAFLRLGCILICHKCLTYTRISLMVAG